MFNSFDGAAILFALAVTALCAVLVYSGSGETRIRISGEGGQWIFPRNRAGAHEKITVSGPLGETVVELSDGEARVLSSPCLNQSCVSAGPIHSPGQWLVCLPNKVFVSVSGNTAPQKNKDDDIDGLSW